MMMWLLTLARFAGMLAMRVWFAGRARMRERARRLAWRNARALVDCARARCAVANIGDATYDVTEIYNCLIDQGAMSAVRMRTAVAEALVDEVDADAVGVGMIIVKFGWRHEGISAKMSLCGDEMIFDICDDVRA